MSEPFANQIDKMSYAMGMNLGEYLNSNPVGLNLDAAVEGLRDSIAGTPRLSRQEYVSAMQLLQQQIQEAGRRQMEQAAAANALAEKNFMAENAKRPGITVTPTLNGLRFSARHQSIRFCLQSEPKQESIRHTPTCFTLMKEAFKPFLSVAALYATDDKGNLFPAELRYRDKGAQTYEVELSCKKSDACIFFEINLYEAKLFQDTTVESAHPDSNHAYDAVGWIGKTGLFGEQWLYSRLDISRISDLTAERVEHVFLLIPVLNQSRCADGLIIMLNRQAYKH